MEWLDKGIEHANENRWYVDLNQWDGKGVRACVSDLAVKEMGEAYNANIFHAFWIAYLKALGVLE